MKLFLTGTVLEQPQTPEENILIEEAPVEELPEDAPAEEAPVEEAPVEEAPVEEAPVEELVLVDGAQQTETETGTLAEEDVVDPAPVPPALLWAGLGVLGGLVLGVLITWLVQNRKRRSRKKKKGPDAITSTAKLAPEPEGPLQLQISKLHDQGARDSQQDSFAVSPAELAPTHGTLAVVCDGMGGLQHGDKVSQTAVSAMINNFLELKGAPEQVLLVLLERANQAVNRFLGPAGQRRSGSTMVAGIVKDEYFHYLSVGDSRICLYRKGMLYQLNREHIYINELSTRAINDELTFKEAWTDPQAAGLTSFLGMGDLKYVDIPAQPVKLLRGDKLILMSDGVYNALTEEELCKALDNRSGPDAEALGKVIAGKAYENQDNYTAVIMTVA